MIDLRSSIYRMAIVLYSDGRYSLETKGTVLPRLNAISFEGWKKIWEIVMRTYWIGGLELGPGS